METTHHSGGLIGVASSINARAKSVASFISNPDRMAIWLVLFAGVVTILKKNGVHIPEYMMLFGVALGIAALLYEMSAARAMMRSFWEGKGFSLMCNSLIWAVAFGFSVNNWIGAASEGQARRDTDRDPGRADRCLSRCPAGGRGATHHGLALRLRRRPA